MSLPPTLSLEGSAPDRESLPQKVTEKAELGHDLTGAAAKSAEEASELGMEPKTSTRSIHGIRWVLVVISILSSIFLYALDNTVVADITPAVVENFGDAFKLPWLSVGFLLGGAAAVLPLGKLYGLFDAKLLYILSCILFNAGSALCGAAPSMDALIIGRVIAGMGGNGMYLGVMTLLSVNTTDKERPGYLSFVGLVWGIGTVLGPVVGGAFVESPATWRWAFYINLCIAGLFAPVYVFWIPSFKPRRGTAMRALLREYDFVGTVLSVGAITALIMAINLGGALYAWNSGQIIGLFVAAVALFALFGAQQGAVLATSLGSRVFPAHFLRDHNAVLLFVCAAAVNAASFIPIYYIPLYFQLTRGDTAIEAAVRLLPLIVVLSAMILFSGHLMGRFGYFQPWYIVGSVLALVGGVLSSRITSKTPQGQLYGYQVLLGIGTGCFTQAGYAVIQAIVPPSEVAYGISFMMLAQLSGIALGLATAGAIFINSAIEKLSALLPNASRQEIQKALTSHGSEYLDSLSGGAAAEAIEAVVEALRLVYVPVYAASALTLVLSCLFTKRKLFADAVMIAA